MRLRRPPRLPRAQLPPPGALRRERRTLLAARERLLRDLGGLIFEMYRQDRFDESLVDERCRELVEVDARLDEIEGLLDTAARGAPARRCACGAELPPFARFCGQCGRPVGESSPA